MTEKPELEIVREFCRELNKNQINYCHWKSNAAIDRSASGENDLDLLISRADEQGFSEILSRLGFKQAVEYPKYQLPGVLNYYGYDKKTGRLIHVHAHYQLVLGHDFTKNYRIPIEGPYLSSSTQNGLFKIPSAEFELIILVIRLMLKHATWDTLLLHQGKLSSSERNELEYLIERASEIKVREILDQHLPYIDPGVFTSSLRMLTTDCRIWDRVRIGQKMVNCLEANARYPQNIDSGLKLWRRLSLPLEKRIFKKDVRKQMYNGGLLIAIVGGDGAGKTTVVNEVNNWLSKDFNVHNFHMGKPKWSMLTILIRGGLKIGSMLGFYPFMRAEIRYTNDPNLLEFPGYPWLIREICTARDRFITYKKARRLATNGKLVVLDRFPLSQIKFMDGPQVARMTASIPKTRLVNLLNNLELSYYQKISFPDLIILLRANPDIAVQRKKDETAHEVRSRSTEVWEIDWAETPVIVVDANNSKEEVLGDVKTLLWPRL